MPTFSHYAPIPFTGPTTPVLDGGNRAAESPVSNSGQWANAPIFVGDAQLQLLDNPTGHAAQFTAVGQVALGSGYMAAIYGARQECFCTVSYYLGTVETFCCVGNPNTSSLNGYTVIWDFFGLTPGADLYRVDNAAFTLLASTPFYPNANQFVAGVPIGMQNRNGLFTLWHGWQILLQTTVPDTTYTSGRIGWRTHGFQYIQAVGGGNIVG